MPHPNFIILYVDNPLTSAAFYADLLDHKPIESSTTFAMFALESGLKLGLWSKHTVEPAVGTILGGGSELAISVSDIDTVHTMHQAWKKRGLTILQAPIKMDFGLNFVAIDPDGHRLRVYAPS